jgi:hypothetical protein
MGEPAEIKRVSLIMTINPDGSIDVKQRYEFGQVGQWPEELVTWVPDTIRPNFLYRRLMTQRFYVFSGNMSDLVQSEVSRTRNGWKVVVPRLRDYLARGPQITVDYHMKRAFSGTRFQANFFGDDSFDGPIREIKVVLHDKSGTSNGIKGDLELRTADRILSLSRKDSHRTQIWTYNQKDVPVESSFTLIIHSLTSNSPISSELSFFTRLQVVSTDNLWLFGPVGFALLLIFMGIILKLDRATSKKNYAPSHKPPEGLDPGSMSIQLQGGVSARYFASSILWLAHREKVMLEYRASQSSPLMGMVISKREDLDTRTRDHERILWNNILFQGVDSISLARLRVDLQKRRRRRIARKNIGNLFPKSKPVRRAGPTEWWLWPLMYQIFALGILSTGIFCLASIVGLVDPAFGRLEWILTWPLVAWCGLQFMARADWPKTHKGEDSKAIMEFTAFFEQHSKMLSKIAGNHKAFSRLFPYAVAAGCERQLLDAYTKGLRTVPLPNWLLMYGTTVERVHVNVLRDMVAGFTDGMIKVF